MSADPLTDAEGAELERLRRRAYGRNADIRDDEAALGRLRCLENRLRPDAPATVGSAADVGDPARQRSSDTVVTTTSVRPQRPAWHTALLAVCAAAALVLGGVAATHGGSFAPIPTDARSAPSPTPSVSGPVILRQVVDFTTDTSSRVLLSIPLDGYFGEPIDIPRVTPLPDFPTDGPLLWAEPIGSYFGAQVWIARTGTGRACLLIDLGSGSHASCVDSYEFEGSALLVTVPFDEIDREKRPRDLLRSESLGFWWLPGAAVIVLAGPTPGAGR